MFTVAGIGIAGLAGVGLSAAAGRGASDVGARISCFVSGVVGGDTSGCDGDGEPSEGVATVELGPQGTARGKAKGVDETLRRGGPLVTPQARPSPGPLLVPDGSLAVVPSPGAQPAARTTVDPLTTYRPHIAAAMSPRPTRAAVAALADGLRRNVPGLREAIAAAARPRPRERIGAARARGMLARRLLAVAPVRPPPSPAPVVATLTNPNDSLSGLCFVAGTLVSTASGLRSIESITRGERVWSRDEETGAIELRLVEAILVTPGAQVVDLTLIDNRGGGETLGATPAHRFWIEGRGWTNLGAVELGDEVVTLDGRHLTVAGLRTRAEATTVYNFDVDDFHTYFVGEAAIWVHNFYPGDPVPQPGGQEIPGQPPVLGPNPGFPNPNPGFPNPDPGMLQPGVPGPPGVPGFVGPGTAPGGPPLSQRFADLVTQRQQFFDFVHEQQGTFRERLNESTSRVAALRRRIEGLRDRVRADEEMTTRPQADRLRLELENAIQELGTALQSHRGIQGEITTYQQQVQQRSTQLQTEFVSLVRAIGAQLEPGTNRVVPDPTAPPPATPAEWDERNRMAEPLSRFEPITQAERTRLEELMRTAGADNGPNLLGNGWAFASIAASMTASHGQTGATSIEALMEEARRDLTRLPPMDPRRRPVAPTAEEIAAHLMPLPPHSALAHREALTSQLRDLGITATWNEHGRISTVAISDTSYRFRFAALPPAERQRVMALLRQYAAADMRVTQGADFLAAARGAVPQPMTHALAYRILRQPGAFAALTTATGNRLDAHHLRLAAVAGNLPPELAEATLYAADHFRDFAAHHQLGQADLFSSVERSFLAAGRSHEEVGFGNIESLGRVMPTAARNASALADRTRAVMRRFFTGQITRDQRDRELLAIGEDPDVNRERDFRTNARIQEFVLGVAFQEQREQDMRLVWRRINERRTNPNYQLPAVDMAYLAERLRPAVSAPPGTHSPTPQEYLDLLTEQARPHFAPLLEAGATVDAQGNWNFFEFRPTAASLATNQPLQRAITYLAGAATTRQFLDPDRNTAARIGNWLFPVELQTRPAMLVADYEAAVQRAAQRFDTARQTLPARITAARSFIASYRGVGLGPWAWGGDRDPRTCMGSPEEVELCAALQDMQAGINELRRLGISPPQLQAVQGAMQQALTADRQAIDQLARTAANVQLAVILSPLAVVAAPAFGWWGVATLYGPLVLAGAHTAVDIAQGRDALDSMFNNVAVYGSSGILSVPLVSVVPAARDVYAGAALDRLFGTTFFRSTLEAQPPGVREWVNLGFSLLPLQGFRPVAAAANGPRQFMTFGQQAYNWQAIGSASVPGLLGRFASWRTGSTVAATQAAGRGQLAVHAGFIAHQGEGLVHAGINVATLISQANEAEQAGDEGRAAELRRQAWHAGVDAFNSLVWAGVSVGMTPHMVRQHRSHVEQARLVEVNIAAYGEAQADFALLTNALARGNRREAEGILRDLRSQMELAGDVVVGNNGLTARQLFTGLFEQAQARFQAHFGGAAVIPEVLRPDAVAAAQTLGVAVDATPEQIRDAFQRQSARFAEGTPEQAAVLTAALVMRAWAARNRPGAPPVVAPPPQPLAQLQSPDQPPGPVRGTPTVQVTPGTNLTPEQIRHALETQGYVRLGPVDSNGRLQFARGLSNRGEQVEINQLLGPQQHIAAVPQHGGLPDGIAVMSSSGSGHAATFASTEGGYLIIGYTNPANLRGAQRNPTNLSGVEAIATDGIRLRDVQMIIRLDTPLGERVALGLQVETLLANIHIEAVNRPGARFDDFFFGPGRYERLWTEPRFVEGYAEWRRISTGVTLTPEQARIEIQQRIRDAMAGGSQDPWVQRFLTPGPAAPAAPTTTGPQGAAGNLPLTFECLDRAVGNILGRRLGRPIPAAPMGFNRQASFREQLAGVRRFWQSLDPEARVDQIGPPGADPVFRTEAEVRQFIAAQQALMAPGTEFIITGHNTNGQNGHAWNLHVNPEGTLVTHGTPGWSLGQLRVFAVRPGQVSRLSAATLQTAAGGRDNFARQVTASSVQRAPDLVVNGQTVSRGGDYTRSFHNQADCSARMLEVLNRPGRVYSGIDADGRPVDVYYHNGDVVITVAGNKNQVLSVQGRSFRGDGAAVFRIDTWSGHPDFVEISIPAQGTGVEMFTDSSRLFGQLVGRFGNLRLLPREPTTPPAPLPTAGPVRTAEVARYRQMLEQAGVALTDMPPERILLLGRALELQSASNRLPFIEWLRSHGPRGPPSSLDQALGTLLFNRSTMPWERGPDGAILVNPTAARVDPLRPPTLEAGTYIWCIGEHGELIIGRDHPVTGADGQPLVSDGRAAYLGHPTLNNGVARVAGEMIVTIVDGQPHIVINNNSGRFGAYPDRGQAQLTAAIETFQRHGIRVNAGSFRSPEAPTAPPVSITPAPLPAVTVGRFGSAPQLRPDGSILHADGRVTNYPGAIATDIELPVSAIRSIHPLPRLGNEHTLAGMLAQMPTEGFDRARPVSVTLIPRRADAPAINLADYRVTVEAGQLRLVPVRDGVPAVNMADFDLVATDGQHRLAAMSMLGQRNVPVVLYYGPTSDPVTMAHRLGIAEMTGYYATQWRPTLTAEQQAVVRQRLADWRANNILRSAGSTTVAPVRSPLPTGSHDAALTLFRTRTGNRAALNEAQLRAEELAIQVLRQDNASPERWGRLMEAMRTNDPRIREAIGRIFTPHASGNWEAYATEFQTRARASIVEALDYYREALRTDPNHPHLAHLRELGFVLGPTAADVRVPTFQEMMLNHEMQLQRHLAAGTVRPEDVLRPARIFVQFETNPDGTRRLNERGQPIAIASTRRYIPFGQEVPANLVGDTSIFPVPFTLNMMREGFFPLGENGPLGPGVLENRLTFAMHDYTHHAFNIQNPRFMGALRAAATALSRGGVFGTESAFYPSRERLRIDPNHSSYAFTPADARVIIDAGRLPEFAQRYQAAAEADRPAILTEAAAHLNAATGQQGLNWRALRIELTNPMTDRMRAAIRFALLLEGAELVPAARADALRATLRERATLPAPTGPQGRYTVAQVEQHLAGMSRADLVRHLQWLTEQAPSQIEHVGGAARDVVQNAQRHDRDPQGFTHYFGLSYFTAQARRLLGNPATTEAQLRHELARLQVGLVESGRVTPEEYARAIAQRTVDPTSELYRLIVESGVYPRDFYWHAFQAAPRPPDPPAAPAPAQPAAQAREPVTIVVATDQGGAIGQGGQMPWNIPSELASFRDFTMGGHLIMGRRTFESIGRPLPGRTTIVITRQADFRPPPGVLVAHSLQEAIDLAGGQRTYIVGGGEIFAQSMEVADRVRVTRIQGDFGGDTHFPALDPQRWRRVSSEPGNARPGETAYTIETWERIPSTAELPANVQVEARVLARTIPTAARILECRQGSQLRVRVAGGAERWVTAAEAVLALQQAQAGRTTPVTFEVLELRQ